MNNLKIVLDDKYLKIIQKSENLIFKDFIKYGELSIDELFNIIDELNYELDRIAEEKEK